MALISKIKNTADSIDYNIRDDVHTWGGRNLFLGSKTNTSTATVNGLTYTWDPNTLTITISGTNTKTNAAWGIFTFNASSFNQIYMNVGESITNNLQVVSGTATGLYLGVNFTNTSNAAYAAGYPNAGTPKTYTFTSTHDATKPCCSVFIGVNANTGAVNCVLKIKIEKGNKPTDWSPAPEDIARVNGTTLELLS